MPYSRAQYVEICKRCTKRGFNPNQGVTCGITNEIANFEGECANFEIDQQLVQKHADQQAYVAAQEVDTSDRNVTLDITLGLIFLIGGLLLTIMNVGYIFYGAILYGIYRLAIGLMNLRS
jgi:hypothetical protein